LPHFNAAQLGTSFIFASLYPVQILPVLVSSRMSIGSPDGDTNLPTGRVGCDAIQNKTQKIAASSSTFTPSIIAPFLVAGV
jgi:hypothetical protein